MRELLNAKQEWLLVTANKKTMVLIEVLITQMKLFLSIKNTDLDRRMPDMVNGSFRDLYFDFKNDQ